MKGPMTCPAPGGREEKGRDFGKFPEMISEHDERVREQDLCGKVKGVGTT